MPSVNIGIRLEPHTALLAASAAAIPSTEPLPYFCGSLVVRRASPLAIKATVLEPKPAKAPIKVPMPVDFKIVGKTDKYSRRLMRPSAGFLDLGMVTSEPWPFLRKATLITSGMTKTPNNIGVNEIPDINSVMPKVKRVAPVILDMPTMANNIPKQHEIKPLGMLFPAMVPITV